MLKKLRIKFVCIIMAVVTVMLCIIFGMVIHFTRMNLEQESTEALQRAASEPGFLPDPYETASSLPYFVMRQDLRGNLKISGTLYFDRYTKEELQEFWATARQSADQIGKLGFYDLKYLRITTPTEVRCVFVDISAQRMVMESLTRVSISVGLLSFFLLLGASVLLAWWAVKPVEKAWQQQRQFVADASHELKTPLTVIMTNAELLQSPEQDDTTRQQFQNSILTMSRQMRGLVEGLLELARVDNGAVKTSFTQVDLSQLAADSILPFEPLYFEKGLTLSAAVERGLNCKGSAAHLRQVLDILLDNAMKYSSPGGEVVVKLKRQGSHCILSVASPGAPISPEDQKNIFTRFYRIDKARSRDGSYGLGLSIAQSIVTEHGGKIWAESSEGGNTFFVQLNLG